MAKVKNQVYDGSEEAYVDASGRSYGIGEFIRHIMTDAYPLPSLNPTGAVRKSPKGFRLTQQGRGSENQAVFRDCFQQCADRWNAMPDECPDPGPCQLISSKKKVWDAKQDAGILSSYYDYFMGCCMSSCTEITITGPSGAAISGGTISADNLCWPCEAPCKTSTLSISYTSQQMQVGQSQLLEAQDSLFGFGVPCCPSEEIMWEIVSGGGYLAPSTGPITVYTAPGANPFCELNAKIKLSDCCDRTASLSIAITSGGNAHAGFVCRTVWLFDPPVGYHYIDNYDCNGTMYQSNFFYNSCEFSGLPESCFFDQRSGDQQTGGCCPTILSESCS